MALLYGLLADLVLVLHVVFVLFVVAGGWLVLRWPRAAWLHVPTALWGAWVEFAGWICPLTPLEDRLRARAGECAASGDFVERLLLPLLYPDWLTRRMQLLLGAGVVVVNVAVYALAIGRALNARRAGSS